MINFKYLTLPFHDLLKKEHHEHSKFTSKSIYAVEERIQQENHYCIMSAMPLVYTKNNSKGFHVGCHLM